MVEINNQRKAFLDMLAWSEELMARTSENRNHGYDVIVGGGNYSAVTPITLANLSRLLKLKSTERRTLPASFPLVGCLPQAAWPERLLLESQDAVALRSLN